MTETHPGIEIIPAYQESRRGPSRPVRNGWHLIVDGEWVQWFATKAEAKAVVERWNA